MLNMTDIAKADTISHQLMPIDILNLDYYSQISLFSLIRNLAQFHDDWIKGFHLGLY